MLQELFRVTGCSGALCRTCIHRLNEHVGHQKPPKKIHSISGEYRGQKKQTDTEEESIRSGVCAVTAAQQDPTVGLQMAEGCLQRP